MKIVCLGFKWFLRLLCWPFKNFAEGIAKEKWERSIQEYRRAEHLDESEPYNWDSHWIEK